MADAPKKLSRKVKLLSDHDVQEIVIFQQYLGDRRTMPREQFYSKYQKYLGMSNAELVLMLAAPIVEEVSRG